MSLSSSVWSLLTFWLGLSLLSNPALALHPEDYKRFLSCYKSKLEEQAEHDQNRPDQIGRNKFDLAIKGLLRKINPLGHDSLYLLFIDRDQILRHRHSGSSRQSEEALFENLEKGYAQSMRAAFQYLSTQVSDSRAPRPLTLEFLTNLNLKTVSGVYSETKRDFLQTGLSLLGHYPFQTNWNGYKMEDDALFELDRSRLLYHQDYLVRTLKSLFPHLEQNRLYRYMNSILDSYSAHYIDGSIHSMIFSEDDLRKDVGRFLDYFNQNITRVYTFRGKLMAIAEVLRALQVSHPFGDGNQRTFAFLTLTKLLIENGAPPAILDDPFIFNGYLTLEQMANRIEKGIQNYLEETIEYQDTLCKESITSIQGYLDSLPDYFPYFKTLPDHLMEF